MTLREIFNAVRGYHQKMEIGIKTTWESARFIAHTCIQPYVTKGKQIKATDLIKFPWETELHIDVQENIERGKALAEKWRKSIPNG